MINIGKMFKRLILKSKIGKCRFKRLILNIKGDIYCQTMLKMDVKGCDISEIDKINQKLDLVSLETINQFDIEIYLLKQLSRV